MRAVCPFVTVVMALVWSRNQNQLKQVLLNLIRNAAESIDERGKS